MKVSVFILMVMLCIPHSLLAGNRSGIVAEQFLKMPTDARSVGMGSASVAIAEGVNSLSSNPSGILSITGVGFSITHTPWFADINHSFVGMAFNLEEIGAIGIGMTMLATDDMAVTTPAHPEGTGEFFRAGDYAFHLAYARQISDQFGVGIGAKYIYSSLYNNVITASALAFDIGALYNMEDIRTKIGISITNLGNDVQFLKEPYSLPTALRFGAAITLMQQGETRLLSTLQVARPNDADEQYNAGFEYEFNNVIALRTGYKFSYEVENFTGGFGINLNSIGINGHLNYGYNNYRVLPGTHTFSIDFGI